MEDGKDNARTANFQERMYIDMYVRSHISTIYSDETSRNIVPIVIVGFIILPAVAPNFLYFFPFS